MSRLEAPGRGNILLITNNLPPVRGGSANVYDSLARHTRFIHVIAPKLSYTDGLPLIGWREHDRLAPYPVSRLRLLRTVLDAPLQAGLPAWARRLRFRASDVLIRVGLVAALMKHILTGSFRAICVGELVASAWLLTMLRLFCPWIVRAVYVHGEEITTRYDTRQDRRRAGLLAADHIIVVSRFTAKVVAELVGPGNQDRIHLIENGVDGARFHPMPPSAPLLALYGLDGMFVFVSVCRLLEKKGIDNAIRAFARVTARHSNTRYLVVGSGDYGQALKQLAVECEVADKVVFTGSVADEELVAHYALGSIFIMPNRKLENGDTEGFGLVFLEANACGLPVIAGSDGGSVDAVQDGVNGLLVDGHSVDSISAAMFRLREDEDLRATLRAGGLRAAADGNWQTKADVFVKLLTR